MSDSDVDLDDALLAVTSKRTAGPAGNRLRRRSDRISEDSIDDEELEEEGEDEEDIDDDMDVEPEDDEDDYEGSKTTAKRSSTKKLAMKSKGKTGTSGRKNQKQKANAKDKADAGGSKGKRGRRDDDDDDEMDDDVLEEEDEDEWRMDVAGSSVGKSKKNQRKSASGSEVIQELEPLVLEFDADGFRDEEDRRNLLKMNEIERENVLADRFEKMQQMKEEYAYRKRMFEEQRAVQKSGGNQKRAARDSAVNSENKRSKKAALDAMAASRSAKGGKKLSAQIEDEVTDDSEEEYLGNRRGMRQRAAKEDLKLDEVTGGSHSKSKLRSDAALDSRMDIDMSVDVIEYADLYDEISGQSSYALLTRSRLERLIEKAHFARIVEGALVRVSVGVDKNQAKTGGAGNRYELGVIKKVKQGIKKYRFGPNNTDLVLVVEHGKKKNVFELHYVSNSKLEREEFEHWKKSSVVLMTKGEKSQIQKRIVDGMNGTLKPTEEETNRHREEFERLNPESLNPVQRRIDLNVQLEALMRDPEKNREKISSTEKLLKDLDEVQKKIQTKKEMESKASHASRDVLRNVHDKNVRQQQAILHNKAVERRIQESVQGNRSATLNPFARMETTGQSYFTIKRKDASVSEPSLSNANASSGPRQESTKNNSNMESTRYELHPTSFHELEVNGNHAPLFESRLGLDLSMLDELNVEIESDELESSQNLIQSGYVDIIKQHLTSNHTNATESSAILTLDNYM